MVHSIALGGGGTASIAIRVPTLRYGLAINGSGALGFAPTMATSITIVGTPQAGMVVAGGFGILHAKRMGQNGGQSDRWESPIIQKGGHTINGTTLKKLKLTKEEARKAMEELKIETLRPPNNHNHTIHANGSVRDSRTGELLGNLYDYLRGF
jgi:hypothetical protein